MSNEASEVLKFEKEWLKYCNSYNDYVQESFKHIEEAITALSQTTCTDAISRQAAIDCITYDEEYTVECLKALPPVKHAEKVGKWIDDKCSICGKGIEDLIDGHEWYINKTPNYCPFCGERMKSEE